MMIWKKYYHTLSLSKEVNKHGIDPRNYHIGKYQRFYNAKNENVENTLGEKAFPPKQQLGLKLSFIKGAAGKPVTLKAAAFDTKVPLRDRMAVELLDEKMPFSRKLCLLKRQIVNNLTFCLKLK